MPTSWLILPLIFFPIWKYDVMCCSIWSTIYDGREKFFFSSEKFFFSSVSNKNTKEKNEAVAATKTKQKK